MVVVFTGFGDVQPVPKFLYIRSVGFIFAEGNLLKESYDKKLTTTAVTTYIIEFNRIGNFPFFKVVQTNHHRTDARYGACLGIQ